LENNDRKMGSGATKGEGRGGKNERKEGKKGWGKKNTRVALWKDHGTGLEPPCPKILSRRIVPKKKVDPRREKN